ncbi:MAG: shikimate dehydrogenase (NADP+) [Anaeromyxobacter sp.]|nr:shikimate dehydrogenase (NADP+) [Anaeromyxobacter sp.]
MIGGRTALYGLVGWPVGHSLSPLMQNAAFAALALDAVYVALPLPPERLGEGLGGAHALGFRGLNVTIPHKEGAAAACVRLDEVAAAVGAANVLRHAPDGWEGHNTDATALLELLREAGVASGARVLLVGAGGAARAGAWAALRLAGGVRVVARRAEQAARLCQALAPSASPGGAGAVPVAWEALAAEAAAADVILNGTSVGLAGHDDRLPGVTFRAGQVALDMVYGDTTFTREAGAAGARVVPGEALLARQGAHAFTRWTGRPAPEAIMIAALQRAREQAPR